MMRIPTPGRLFPSQTVHLLLAFWTMTSVFLSALPASAAGLEAVALRCEYRENPLGIDETKPRLSWRVDSRERGQRQTAYQILVATGSELLQPGKADLWDSGKVSSDETVNVEYGGKELSSGIEYFWTVRTWDVKGEPSAWSKPAMWSMGLLHANEWRADYISYRDDSAVHKDPSALFLPAARQYRKEFNTAKPVKRATIYATALGVYELHVNGKRVGDALFAPGWTDYRQRAYYYTYDITKLLNPGLNAVGAWVADGWYSGYLGFALLTGVGVEKVGRYSYGKTPALMAQLEIQYEDGTREILRTDRTWKVTAAGPIREADFLMGEYYDARKEMPGWATAGFDDAGWDNAIAAQENGPAQATFYEFANGQGDKGPEVVGREVDLGFKRPPVLQAFPGMPIRHIEEIKPIGITSPSNGVYIFNLGQNFAGVVRLKVKGPAGTVVRLRHGEMLHPDGRLMTENLRKARAIDHYVLRGDKRGETYVPRFTFHGFQYVEVTGYPGKPGMDAITGIVLHSDTPLTSDFTCSDPVSSRLFKNIVWTQRANFVDLPTDCPQRDERFGWTGDAQVYVRTATYNADVAAFYTKWLRELMESQRPSGTFPGYAPFPFQHGWDFGTAWCDAGVICPWTVWRAYNDTRIIERCWDPMVKFIQWRQNTSKDYLGAVHGNDWGDWLSFGGKTPLDYIDTVYFACTTRMMAEMGDAIGKKEEAAEHRDLAQKIKQAFNKKYVKPDGSLAIDTQTAYSLALFMDLIPADLRLKSGSILAEKIRSNASSTNSGITTGFLGTRPLLPVLSAVGQHDLAVQLFQSRKFPSWGYEIEQGATTIWERWNSYTKDNGFGGEQNASMNSFAHYSFGAVGEWMFFQLAGIDSDLPSFKHILIKPTPPAYASNHESEPINWVKAQYDSIRGRIVSNWRLSGDRFELETTIPPNTTATVYLPTRTLPQITEAGHPLNTVKGVQMLGPQNDRVAMEVESGTYKFACYFTP
jgi:alpha-L-rhamnosidase